MQNIEKIKALIKKRVKFVALLAPSFVAEFSYPEIISQLNSLGIDKIVELTFGAKMINRDYHKILHCSNCLLIATTCPGIVEYIIKNYPQYKKNLIPVDSPMIATAKICKKIFPKHKTIFIAPCDFKKTEAENSRYVDYVIDYQQLKILLDKNKFNKNKINKTKPSLSSKYFDKFYNDYTKVYPLSGGLSKTAHIRGILKNDETKIIDGILELNNFMKNPNKKIKFIDATFCKGGCIGGPHLSKNLSLAEKRKRVLKYIELAKKEKMPCGCEGLVEKANGISFRK